jgi:hypothetical protein
MHTFFRPSSSGLRFSGSPLASTWLGLPLIGLILFGSVAPLHAQTPPNSQNPQPKLHPALIQAEDIRRESPTESLKAWRKSAADRRRRIILNNDGNEAVVHMTRPSADDFLKCRTSGLVGSQVDSIFYCTTGGFGTFKHLTKVGQLYTLRMEPHADNQLQAMAEKGLDPLKIMTDFGKQHGIEIFCSFRMNDIHDKGLDPYEAARFRFNQVKSEHPEYLMGTPKKQPKHGGWSAVDYGRPEIRELAFRYIEEVCRNYEVDGVELDFFRHPVFFRSTTRGQRATDDECAEMTALLRRIRIMADEAGKKRGRPILIATRVPDSLEYSRAIGLEIDRWMADDLLDLLVVSGYFQLNDWDYSVALARKYGVKVYPSLDESRVRDEPAKQMRSTDRAYRGRAANIWAAAADGVYLFNSFDPTSPCWRELGDPRLLAKTDKDYFASVRGVFGANGGNLPFESFQKCETLTPMTPKVLEPGKKAATRIQLGNVLAETTPVIFRLRLRFEAPLNAGALRASMNGRSLELQAAGIEWLEATLRAADLRQGINEVEVSMPENAVKMKWTDLVLEVRH